MKPSRTTDDRDEHDLDRLAQYLPVPLGGLAPAHRKRRALAAFWHRRGGLILGSLGLLAAGAGLWFQASPRSINVYSDRVGVHIGDVQLREASADAMLRVFSGDAAWAVQRVDRGRLYAGGSAILNGRQTSGHCQLSTAEMVTRETCTFSIDGAQLTSDDRFDSHARRWQRTYSDGRQAYFVVPEGGDVVPVPLPLGR
jgi:hypothetical protein